MVQHRCAMLSRRCFISLGAGVGVLATVKLADAQEEPGFQRFKLPGAPVTISYPADMFFRTEPQPPQEGTILFLSKDGRASFNLESRSVSADWTIGKLADAAEAALAEQKARGIFKRVGEGWYVFSGLFDDKIFYYKVVLSNGGSLASTFQMTYPQAERGFYRDIVARMSRSFQPAP